MKISRDELIGYLISKWNYNPIQAPETADKLLRMDPGTLAGFEGWLDNGEFPESPVFSGFSAKSLQARCKLKPPAIFLLLDWIRREPKEAIQAIEEEFS